MVAINVTNILLINSVGSLYIFVYNYFCLELSWTLLTCFFSFMCKYEIFYKYLPLSFFLSLLSPYCLPYFPLFSGLFHVSTVGMVCEKGIQILLTIVGAFASFGLMTVAIGTDYWLYSRALICNSTANVTQDDPHNKDKKDPGALTHSGLWRICCLEGQGLSCLWEMWSLVLEGFWGLFFTRIFLGNILKPETPNYVLFIFVSHYNRELPFFTKWNKTKLQHLSFYLYVV